MRILKKMLYRKSRKRKRIFPDITISVTLEAKQFKIVAAAVEKMQIGKEKS